jgi:transposase
MSPDFQELTYVRLFIHGARSLVLRLNRERSPMGNWISSLEARAHRNVVIVAMAHKLARII